MPIINIKKNITKAKSFFTVFLSCMLLLFSNKLEANCVSNVGTSALEQAERCAMTSADCESMFFEFGLDACDSITWNGQLYTVSGIYTHTFVAANGCDSVVTLHLTIYPTYIAEMHNTVCGYEPGIYYQSNTYSTVNGCDSIVILCLTTIPNYEEVRYITICGDEPGTYTQTYTYSAVNGCDSIVTLHFTTMPNYEIMIPVTAYDYYEWEGIVYTESGVYTNVYTTIFGCDSIVTLNLTILQPDGVNDFNNDANITIYPNPTDDNVNIKLEGINGNVSIKILDNVGRALDNFNTHVCSSGEIISYSLDKFSKGIYFFVISDDKNTRVNKVIVK